MGERREKRNFYLLFVRGKEEEGVYFKKRKERKIKIKIKKRKESKRERAFG